MLCFRKIPVAIKFMGKRVAEYQDFPLNIFRLTRPKNALGEPFSHSLISGIEKVLMKGWGLCQDFPPKIFGLTVRKNAVG